MNIEIANRLVNLRKTNNLSQEALAEKLGISRQAVSKWERAEASPDTDNLILLARLYGVSLDELLKTEDEIPAAEFREEKENAQEAADDGQKAAEKVEIGSHGIYVSDKDGSQVHIGWNGIHVQEADGQNVHIGRGVQVNGEDITMTHGFFPQGLIVTIVTVAFLLLGSIYDVWHPAWLLFLLIPIEITLLDAFKKKNPMLFAYPVLTVLLFFICGIFYNAWHPGWIWFITIPAYYSLAEYFKNVIRRRDEKVRKEQQETAFNYSGRTDGMGERNEKDMD